MDSHHGTRACLDLMEMIISMLLGAPPELLPSCGVAGGRRRWYGDQVMTKIFLGGKINNSF